MVSRLVIITLVLALVFVLPFAQGNQIWVGYKGTKFTLYELGCWKDKPFPNRALLTLYHNARHNIDWSKWPDMSDIIAECAYWAKVLGYEYFAVQFYGECWGYKPRPSRYMIYGRATNCVNGVGEHWSNFVYSFSP
ncbi:uncharacterized protein LOC116619476 [Nematostella vectensis]|uniref:uncharacterized protein LOC116619476 n=1 Tax=Nematostella vectensis TaxID=45351 RepID=UPI00207717E6|nr:uncharacterized protein LOC116619476 [Nematostella vectensis]